MFAESRMVSAIEYSCEVQQRPVTVMRCVPEVHQVQQSFTVMVPKTRVRQQVCMVSRPVVEEVQQRYLECVPEQVVRQGVRTVCRPVQVQEMRTVCRDLGHWEQAASYSKAPHRLGCLGIFACGACAPVVCCTQMVWVPNIVEEQVPVTVCRMEMVQQPYQFVTTVYRQVPRTRVVQVCRYVPEQQVREVTEVICVPERRERLCNVTTYRQVAEQVMQQCRVMVPHRVEKEVQVMVCRMVPRQVCCKVPVSCCK
jgi:hypothetical protein